MTVFDAVDIVAEATFWAGLVEGQVWGDEHSQCVFDRDGAWCIGVQHAPGHVPPDWPDGAPQQVHLDLHVTDPQEAHDRAMGLGARLLGEAADFSTDEGHQVYADPAGHPFCLGWGHPSPEAVRAFLAERLG